MVVVEEEEEEEEEEEGACCSPQPSHLSKTHFLVASLLFLASWNGSESESERREKRGSLEVPANPGDFIDSFIVIGYVTLLCIPRADLNYRY